MTTGPTGKRLKTTSTAETFVICKDIYTLAKTTPSAETLVALINAETRNSIMT